MPKFSDLDSPALQDALDDLQKTPSTEGELQILLHELQVHQIELEQQNRELQDVQAELEASRDRYADLYDLAPVGYLSLGRGGMIQEINLTACTLLGVERQQALHRPLGRFLLQGEKRTLLNHLSLVETSRQHQRLEVRMRRLTGERFEASLDTDYVQSLFGGPVCRAALLDISKQKRLERELFQARKLQAIGQLTGGIAHDFNNMLATILGFAELIDTHLENIPVEKLRGYMQHILTAGHRGEDLVAQMLTFARATPQDDAVPNKTATLIELGPLVKEISRMLEAIMPSSIQTQVNIADKLPRAAIDPGQFQQVLMNLCVNARDAMDGKGQLSIGLRTVQTDDVECDACHKHINGDWLELVVADTGSGIDEAALEQIFDPFFTTKTVGKGTGMGLSVVHGIATQENAHILVDSQPGMGSYFRFLMPIIEQALHPVKLESAPIKPAAGHGEHILVVDDERYLTEFLKDYLDSHGYRVSAVTDSREALNLLRTCLKTPQFIRGGGAARWRIRSESWPRYCAEGPHNPSRGACDGSSIQRCAPRPTVLQ